MKVKTKIMKRMNKRNKKISTHTVMLFLVFHFIAILAQAQTGEPQMLASKDGTLISYEVHGKGEPTLVFVHGWSCDSRYWRHQIETFSRDYKMVLVDVAGHGHSGSTREKYTMQAFGEDVKAVLEATGDQKVILIGHSMGGAIIAEAARLMPEKVVGLIGVDTYENIEYPLSPEEYKQMIDPFKQDFEKAMQQFVQYMIVPETDSVLKDWIIADMSAAPATSALSALEDYLTASLTGQGAKIFDEIRVPVLTINGDMWPIDYEANRRHMLSFDASVIKGADHFLMMNRKEEFNKALEQSINKLLENDVKK